MQLVLLATLALSACFISLYANNFLPRHVRGDTLFGKNCFFDEKTRAFLKTHEIDHKYCRYYEPFFKVYYDLDDDPKDTVKTTLKQGLAYEGNIGLIIDHLTKPGSLALDIGSHIGVHTITMSRKVGSQGTVIAFEPDKKLYMELLHNLNLNNCNNVVSICKALGDDEKIVSLKNNHIQQDSDVFWLPNAEGITDAVETITLDSLKIDNLSIIKMDVENYEYFVLKGAKETILKNKPVILFECWIGADYENANSYEKENFDRVISLIKSYEYEIYVIYCNDFIAFPLEATAELIEYKKRFKKLDLDHFDLGL